MSLDPSPLPVESERDDERAAYTRITRLAARLAGASVAVLCLRRDAAAAMAYSVGLGDALPDEMATALAALGVELAPEATACVVPAPAMFAAVGLTSAAVAPLTLADGQAAGALWVADRHPRTWDPQVLDDVAACAELAADLARLANVRTAQRRAADELQQRSYALDALRAEATDATEELEHFFAISLDMLCIAGFDGCFKRLNPACEQILGYTPAELLAEPFLNYVHEDDRAATICQLEQLVAGNSTRSFENRYRCKDGSFRWILWNAVPVVEHSVIYAAARDITARKHAEEELRQYAVDLLVLHLLEQQARQLAETLRAVNSTLTQSLQLETVIETILRAIRQLIPDAEAQITLLDAREPEVYQLAGEGEGGLEHRTPGEPWEAPDGRHELPAPVAGGREEPPVDQGRHASAGAQGVSRLDVPLVAEGDVIGAFTVMVAGEDAFSTRHRQFVETVAEQASVALQNARLFAEVQRSRAQLQTLSQQLIRAQDDERRAIARELHDEIGQGLIALQLSLGVANTTHDPAQVMARLLDCRALVERLIAQVRSLSRELRPALLDDLGLGPALSWYLDQLAERSGLRMTLSARINDVQLSPEITIACFRIVQEALNNVVRHARATRVWVDLRYEEGQLRLAITDDGQGFEVEATRLRAAHEGSLGLLNMRERALLVQGTFELISSPGAGTCVRVKIRLPQPD